MNHRVFIGIPISHELQEIINEWKGNFPQLHVRWLRGKNIHATILPPWYTTNVEKEQELLRTFKGSGSFSLGFHTVEYGPVRQAHLIWATGTTPEKFTALHERTAKLFGQAAENRSPLLHLTLARFRKEQFSSFSVKKLHEEVVWSTPATSLVLYNSHLSSTGADYEILEEVKL